MKRRSKISSSFNLIPFLPHILIGFLGLSFIGFLLIIQDPPLIRTSLPGVPSQSVLNYKNVRLLRDDDHKTNKRRNQNDISNGSNNDSEDTVGNNFLTTSNNVLSNNELVHIVNTRFMQMQGNLTNLGQARLQIFKHFCLPTMIHQKANFLWVIRTDPNLDSQIKSQMMALLEPYPHFLLVANNGNPEYFREVTDVVNKTQVWSGSIDIARSYLEKSKDNYVLETRLDSDDGLASETLKQLQTSASSTVENKYEKKDKSWTVWCLSKTLEWHMKYKSKESSGLIIPFLSDMCLTPSLTVGFPPGVSRKDLPTMKHQKLHKIVPACTHLEETKCMRKIVSKSDLTSGAIRVRCPTSSGMSNVLSVPKAIEAKWDKYQDKFWKRLPEAFSISKNNAEFMNQYLSDNIRYIAEDNLKGQCTKGHSCKKESKEKLKIIIEKTAKSVE